jgi:hypothetical protein
MATYLSPLGVVNDGVVLRDNWWIHTQMPTVTVEPAFLSNTREASLVATPGFQQVLAMAVRAGIESYDPQLLQRKAQILAWNAAHPDHPVTPPASPVAVHATAVTGVKATASGWLGTLVRYTLVLALLGAVVRWPRTAYLMARADLRFARTTFDRVVVRRNSKRRRRRAVALLSLEARAQRFARPHHIYDELF